jgi:hypothetical protein
MQECNVEYTEHLTKVKLNLSKLNAGIMELVKKACVNTGKKASSAFGKASVVKTHPDDEPVAGSIETLVRVVPAQTAAPTGVAVTGVVGEQ